MTELSPKTAALLGLVAGGVYFLFEESHRPAESNCSYLSPITTDIFAFIGSGLLLWRGVTTEDPLITAIGGTVFGIHAGQVLHYKLGKG